MLETFDYDDIGNIKSIVDGRVANDWPSGAKPVTRSMNYDGAHRVTQVSYEHANDSYVSPFEAEEAASNALPLPRSIPTTGYRVKSQAYTYDVLGNVTSANDDAVTSFDRGLGTITTGSLAASTEPSRKPNQLLFATGPTAGGAVEAHHDAAGNLTGRCAGARRHVLGTDWEVLPAVHLRLGRGRPARARAALGLRHDDGPTALSEPADGAGVCRAHVQVFGRSACHQGARQPSGKSDLRSRHLRHVAPEPRGLRRR